MKYKTQHKSSLQLCSLEPLKSREEDDCGLCRSTVSSQRDEGRDEALLSVSVRPFFSLTVLHDGGDIEHGREAFWSPVSEGEEEDEDDDQDDDQHADSAPLSPTAGHV